jgi:hypothetical protein
MLALLHMQEPVDEVDSESRDLQYAAENAMKLFDDIESTIYSLDLRSALDLYPMAVFSTLHISPGFPLLPHWPPQHWNGMTSC